MLDPTVLIDAILRLTDRSRADWVGLPTVLNGDGTVNIPATHAVTAGNWANVAVEYFGGIVVPVVLPAVHALARSAFENAMLPVLNGGGPIAGFVALQAGFTAYAAALIGGVVPPGVALPPTTPLVITPGPPTVDPTPAAVSMAAAIDAWARTGLYGIPPATPVPPWS